MSWCSRLQTWNYSDPEGRYAYRQEMRPPASHDAIEQSENQLTTRFPESLRSLLLETNGVMRLMSLDGQDWFEELWSVWPLAKIIEENLWHRERYTDRGICQFVFFAGAGVDGIQLGFHASSAALADCAVYAWYSDETEDKVMAGQLDRFLEGWCSGQLNV